MKKIFKRAAVAVAVLSLLIVGTPQETHAFFSIYDCFLVIVPNPCRPGGSLPIIGGGGHMCPGTPPHLSGTWGVCHFSLEID